MQRSAGGSRRHWVLQAGFTLATFLLCVRLCDIQYFRHDFYRAKAEGQWQSPLELPPERGNLYDRNAQPLASSVISWRIGVATKLLAEPAEIAALLAEILPLSAKTIRRRIQAADGHVVLARQTILSPTQYDQLRGQPAITLENLSSRIYPLDGIGASVIGFYRCGKGQEPDLTTGLERSLALYLAGTPGKAWQLESAKPGEPMGTIVLQKPQHGLDVVLTLDADLQEICEKELASGVQRYSARGGAVLIVDPSCGDVLAAASWPLLKHRNSFGGDPALWNNFNFTGQYEPGSVFKIFTAASLLRNGAIDTATVFDCGDVDFGAFKIRNSDGHSYEILSFMEAFAQSCNIYFARATANLSAHEFYRDLTEFGFGQRTRFPYEAQTAGSLQPPAKWSGRSKATIAIGQEVAVTPLQLAMAVSAVANGGTLYAPRIVREIRDHDGTLLEKCEPTPLRRVLSEPLAALLREAMARAVSHGTGQSAAIPWIRTGGKTGTAQKSIDGRAYTRGKYMASFAGCVPIDRPRLVILTILDEPAGINHYAAQSAAPMFKNIVTEIRRCTDWLTGVSGMLTKTPGTVGGTEVVSVPDVLYLPTFLAEEELRRAGLQPSGSDKEGLVVEQIPGPGTICSVGDRVEITVAVRQNTTSVTGPICPDLHGLSNREVRRIAARLGVDVHINGVGYVSNQQPPAGNQLGSAGIQVRMVSLWP